jgi:hypothetical protein
MQVPKFLSFLSPYTEGDSPTRLVQGLVVGAVATMYIGFSWGGWHLGSTVDQKVETASTTAMVAALAPICADKFKQAAKADNALVASLRAVDLWEREEHLMKTGWATFSGEPEPNRTVAEACAKLLSATLKLK